MTAPVIKWRSTPFGDIERVEVLRETRTTVTLRVWDRFRRVTEERGRKLPNRSLHDTWEEARDASIRMLEKTAKVVTVNIENDLALLKSALEKIAARRAETKPEEPQS